MTITSDSEIYYDPFNKEILPEFKSVREKGLNMIDASELHHIKTVAATGPVHAAGD